MAGHSGWVPPLREIGDQAEVKVALVGGQGAGSPHEMRASWQRHRDALEEQEDKMTE